MLNHEDAIADPEDVIADFEDGIDALADIDWELGRAVDRVIETKWRFRKAVGEVEMKRSISFASLEKFGHLYYFYYLDNSKPVCKY